MYWYGKGSRGRTIVVQKISKNASRCFEALQTQQNSLISFYVPKVFLFFSSLVSTMAMGRNVAFILTRSR